MKRDRSYRFSWAMRISRRREFENLFARGRRRRRGRLTVIILANDLGHPRLGVSVSKQVGNAVARNRVKRRLRESFRLSQHELGPVDIICIPRAGFCSTVAELRRILIDCGRVD